MTGLRCTSSLLKNAKRTVRVEPLDVARDRLRKTKSKHERLSIQRLVHTSTPRLRATLSANGEFQQTAREFTHDRPRRPHLENTARARSRPAPYREPGRAFSERSAQRFGVRNRASLASGTILINQVLASPVEGGIGRILLRIGGAEPFIVHAVGPGARIRLGVTEDRVVWEGETGGIRHRVTLKLQPEDAAWLWHVHVFNARNNALPLDAILVQDIGLGVRGFLANNEAYASQYIDHHSVRHPRYGPIVMCRQNLAQDGKHPWVVHGCLDGASGFATDAMQLFGPGYRDSDAIGFRFGDDLPSRRLQHEAACAAIQPSPPVTLEPGGSVAWRFFGLYHPDHPDPSSDADLLKIDAVGWCDPDPADVVLAPLVRALVQDAPSIVAAPLSEAALAQRYPQRFHEEHADGKLLSFFIPDPPHNRHVVLRDKERRVTRRHGTLLRTGQAMLPDDSTLCATCWMHGVFGAQLTIGNTSFHKLFSVSRDPYNIMRASGLRMLIDTGDGWRLLTVPSAFEMGLSDCRWIYCLDERVVTVRAIAAGDDPAMQWRITVEGEPCRLLVFGHVVLGERELEHEGIIEVDPGTARLTFRPDPNSLWGQRYPHAVYHLVTSAREVIEAIGGDELLYAARVSSTRFCRCREASSPDCSRPSKRSTIFDSSATTCCFPTA
ncbi:MAG: hypothetical protein HY527_03515 [Betaproteobacteria bacterium]|nr:hypothetical protein [Betaproteobacteria bacterium]